MKMPGLPKLEDEDRAFLHYNPNTQDLVDFVHAYALSYGKAVLEAAAEATNKRADDVRKANTYRGRIGSASRFVVDQLEFAAAAIRSMGKE